MIDRSPNGKPPIHHDVNPGRAQLNVADLECALAFYGDGLGFAITGRLDASAAFLAAISNSLASDRDRLIRDGSPRSAGGTADDVGDTVGVHAPDGSGVGSTRDCVPAKGSGDERRTPTTTRERHESSRLATHHEPAAASSRRATRADRARWFEQLAR